MAFQIRSHEISGSIGFFKASQTTWAKPTTLSVTESQIINTHIANTIVLQIFTFCVQADTFKKEQFIRSVFVSEESHSFF